jgi:hypothetical protein
MQASLESHISKEPNISYQWDHEAAQGSDRAETPDEAFQAIKNRIRITKHQFWDPSRYYPQWSYKAHVDALSEPWHGDFVFRNPPYSLGAKFISKALIEFMEGKNIVLLIP